MTAEELFDLADDGGRFELVEGELVHMTPSGGTHGALTVRIGRLLDEYVEAHDLGVCCGAETGFILQREPDTVRAPEAAVVVKSRVPSTGIPSSYWPFAPDLAVEVVSPVGPLGRRSRQDCRVLRRRNPPGLAPGTRNPDGPRVPVPTGGRGGRNGGASRGWRRAAGVQVSGTAAFSWGSFILMSLEFALTEKFVGWYCGTIVAFALFFAGRLAWHALPLYRRLRNVNKALKDVNGEQEFVGAFEQYDSHVEQAFGLPWMEFVETLVLPEPESGDPIRNTGEVSRYLNDATIIFPRISSGFYQAVPNLLTGMGILGTFLGLAGGVGSASSGLSSSNPGEITAALQQLLGGASLAFWTSIVGIVCSILFVLVERYASRSSMSDWTNGSEPSSHAWSASRRKASLCNSSTKQGVRQPNSNDSTPS